MAFKFTDSHISDYYMHGYTVFRSILPPALIGDLRKATDQSREIARAQSGAQVQRLQPVSRFALDQKPFQDFAELPELRNAVSKVLSPRYTYATQAYLGVLLEPAELPWCTMWHRDWRDNNMGMKLAEWDAVRYDFNFFNQLNCALYDDDATWVVPGSHLRRDVPAEVARFPNRPLPGPDLEGKNYEERERLCLEYCQSLPGAVCLHLNAGDFALYRNSIWHIGNYLPYRKRATLHDVVDTPEYSTWRDIVIPQMKVWREQGIAFENPNRSNT